MKDETAILIQPLNRETEPAWQAASCAENSSAVRQEPILDYDEFLLTACCAPQVLSVFKSAQCANPGVLLDRSRLVTYLLLTDYPFS